MPQLEAVPQISAAAIRRTGSSRFCTWDYVLHAHLCFMNNITSSFPLFKQTTCNRLPPPRCSDSLRDGDCGDPGIYTLMKTIMGKYVNLHGCGWLRQTVLFQKGHMLLWVITYGNWIPLTLNRGGSAFDPSVVPWLMESGWPVCAKQLLLFLCYFVLLLLSFFVVGKLRGRLPRDRYCFKTRNWKKKKLSQKSAFEWSCIKI